MNFQKILKVYLLLIGFLAEICCIEFQTDSLHSINIHLQMAKKAKSGGKAKSRKKATAAKALKNAANSPYTAYGKAKRTRIAWREAKGEKLNLFQRWLA